MLPFGPQRPPPDYARVVQLAADTSTLDQGMLEWLQTSRLQWNELSGDSDKFQPARFIWASACGQRAQQQIGSSTVSFMWRVVARRAHDIARIIRGGLLLSSETHRKAVAGHLQAATDAARSLCNSVQAGVAPQIARWSSSLRAAISQASIPWIASLAKVVDLQAMAIEETTSRSCLRRWRVTLGASTGSMPQATPTKAAYRWVRGLVGWHHSPVGAAELNYAVPDEGEDGSVNPNPEVPDEPAVRSPLADQMVVESEADELGQLWHEGSDYSLPSWPAEQQQLQ